MAKKDTDTKKESGVKNEVAETTQTTTKASAPKLVIKNTTKQLRIIVYTDNKGNKQTVKFVDKVELPYSDELFKAVSVLKKNGKITLKKI